MIKCLQQLALHVFVFGAIVSLSVYKNAHRSPEYAPQVIDAEDAQNIDKILNSFEGEK